MIRIKDCKIIAKKCKKCNDVKSILKFFVKRKKMDGTKTYEGSCKACKNKGRYAHKLVCEECGNNFMGSYNKQQYCSDKCRAKSTRNQVEYECDTCGKFCNIKASHYYNKENHFCSEGCMHKYQSIAWKGENSPLYKSIEVECDFCNKKFPKVPSGIKNTNFCSQECMGKWREGRFCGENSPKWNPDLLQEDREKRRNVEGYIEFIKEVYERDNYTCQICGDNSGGNLNVHHLNGYNWDRKNRTNIDNGITLCKCCHKKFHKDYGKGNNTKEQFEKWRSA